MIIGTRSLSQYSDGLMSHFRAQLYYRTMENIAMQMHFVIFINSKSGNGDGERFLHLGQTELTIHYEGISQGHLYFIDLFSPESRQQGLQLIKTFLTNSAEFRVIVCGGDGTISWVLSEILNEGISLTRITLGIIPIGTGNDFSRSLGWGSQTVKVSKENYKNLSSLVKRWMNAGIGCYDMWDILVETFPDGKIYDIKNERENDRQETSFKRMFSNYVGLGLDARVVYTMERHRTPYAWLNKIAYGLVGCLNFFRPLIKLDQKVDSISETVDIICEDESTVAPLISEKSTRQSQKSSMLSKYPIEKGKCGLVCLNCTSYMAGLRKVWQTNSISNVNIDKKRATQYFKEQKVDDGMVEFVSYRNELSLALERIMRSGSKVLQGGGPFQIKMKEPTGKEVTHMQIDGQSMKIINLKSVIIKRTDKIADHKLRVMVGDIGE